MSGTYICKCCGEKCEKNKSIEEMVVEMKKNFGDIPEDQRSIVCPECFGLMKRFTPEVMP